MSFIFQSYSDAGHVFRILLRFNLVFSETLAQIIWRPALSASFPHASFVKDLYNSNANATIKC
jgi:hypothetical protein